MTVNQVKKHDLIKFTIGREIAITSPQQHHAYKMTIIHFPLDRCNEDCASLLDNLTNDIAEEKIIFLTSYYESHQANSKNYYLFIQNTIHEIKKLKPRSKIFVLFDSVYERDHRSVQLVGADDILFLDYFLYALLQHIKVHDVSKVAYKWNKRSSKFLCLTGQIFRINRLGLLYKIFQKNLLNDQNCVWSLHKDTAVESEIKLVNLINQMPELSRQKIAAFVKNKMNYPDDLRIITSGYKYDVNLYAGTKFSVVSEAYFSCTSSPMITEKTWKAILNYHPFIIAGDTGICDKLNRMNFVTYEKFLKYPDYDLVDDNMQRLNQIVDNTEFWYNHINDYENEINEITDYNHQSLMRRYDKLIDLITNFADKNHVTASVSEIVLIDPGIAARPEKKDDQFVTFYNSVRDQSWPDVSSREDFDFLPNKIQLELTQQFGYVHTDG